MNQPEELEQLWKTQPLGTPTKGEDMRRYVLNKIASFDRTIRVRNTVESLAALLVAGLFAYMAFPQQNTIERLGKIMIVAAALWIIYYLRFRGGKAAEPPAEQTVASYVAALRAKYDYQIRLLRNVKFWYLLPFYIGLLTLTAGQLAAQAHERPLSWANAIPPLVYSLVFAGVWWLNEVYAIRHIKRLRDRLSSSLDEQLTG
jgi:uncharacterized membrane protein